MICLFTDFGCDDPYVGQLHIAIRNIAVDCVVIDLLHTVSAFNIHAAAYLLPAYTRSLPIGTVCVCVVDPGVGSTRPAVAYRVDGQWYVGPDNGLFEVVYRRGTDVRRFRIDWRPPALCASFHGRDLFAPTAARLVLGDTMGLRAERRHIASTGAAGSRYPPHTKCKRFALWLAER